MAICLLLPFFGQAHAIVSSNPKLPMNVSSKVLSENSVQIELSNSAPCILEVVSPFHSRLSYLDELGVSVAQYDIISNDTEVTVIHDGKTVFSQKILQTQSPSTNADIGEITVGDFGPRVVHPMWHYNEWWDGVNYAYDGSAMYPHPDKDFYTMPYYDDYFIEGIQLYHIQINSGTSDVLARGGPTAIGAFIGSIIGSLFGSPITTALCAGLGALFASIMYNGVTWKDENGCIWYEISEIFLYWLYSNFDWLVMTYLLFGETAFIGIVVGNFYVLGYLRVGEEPFHDGIGAGSP